ncbi:hypothetical protein CROQUDRAFT_650023 [Cronartium quercuum f. sp. fusiforme G11]|uniref:Uncharacterized protein n=1 Tax=Cronartium quercuum f. sp. fusiforme G11 TaxID=708437 RepID=A0A9P6NUM7_9BASI|nr:hypothetical protein CROQUDRAFT_650023 [Cronartium quercuum f. sp. fusiforme G11]
MSNFSAKDHFIPLISNCLSCLPSSRKHKPINEQDYFPDSISAPLLEPRNNSIDFINLNLNYRNSEYINHEENLNNWELIKNWFSFKIFTQNINNHERRLSESDAPILTDLSFLLNNTSSSSSSCSNILNHKRKQSLNQLELISPQLTNNKIKTDEELILEEERLAKIEEEEYKLARKRAKAKAKALGLLNTNSKSSNKSLSKSSSKSKMSSKSSSTIISEEEERDSELFSNSNTIESNPTTIESSNSINENDPNRSSLTPEIIQLIRDRYESDANELYGTKQLNLIQIEQIYDYLSTQSEIENNSNHSEILNVIKSNDHFTKSICKGQRLRRSNNCGDLSDTKPFL